MIWRYFTMRDFMVGPSAASSNGNVADGQIKWRCPVWEVEEFKESVAESGQSCSTSTVGYQIERINYEKASLLQRILEH